MENSRLCEICNLKFQRASMHKDLGSEKHWEKEK